MRVEDKIFVLNEVLGAEYPNPRSELQFESPFQLLVATMLAAQATDRQVNVITRELFKRAPDAVRLSGMELETVVGFVRSINYCNTKAKHILEASRILVDRFGGEVPRTREELESLPGVGRKTANVVLSGAFGQAVMAVDTHVHRVSNRIGLVRTEKPEHTETELMKIIPESRVIDFHHYLLFHGRYTCKAKKPLCSLCRVSSVCDYPSKS